MNQLRVHLRHLSAVRGFSTRPGLCRAGARAWFAQHRLDWNAFRRDGIDAAVLVGIGDPFALAVVDVAAVEQAEVNRGR